MHSYATQKQNGLKEISTFTYHLVDPVEKFLTEEINPLEKILLNQKSQVMNNKINRLMTDPSTTDEEKNNLKELEARLYESITQEELKFFKSEINHFIRKFNDAIEECQIESIADNIKNTLAKGINDIAYSVIEKMKVEKRASLKDLENEAVYNVFIRIFRELFKNSIDAHSSYITIHFGQDQKNDLYFEVEDNGTGFNPAKILLAQDGSYQSFEKLTHETTMEKINKKNQTGGRGLGLYLLKFIAEFFHGALEVKNKFNEKNEITGSSLMFRIPSIQYSLIEIEALVSGFISFIESESQKTGSTAAKKIDNNPILKNALFEEGRRCMNDVKPREAFLDEAKKVDVVSCSQQPDVKKKLGQVPTLGSIKNSKFFMAKKAKSIETQSSKEDKNNKPSGGSPALS